MKRTFSFFSKKNVLRYLVLTGFVFLLSLNNTMAQNTPTGGNNPYTGIAQDFNVIAYTLGTFNRDEVIVALEDFAAQLEPLIHTNPSLLPKYKYVTSVLTDVQTYWIAVEVSLLTNLETLHDNVKVPGQVGNHTVGAPSTTLFTNMYNEVVSAIQ